MEICRFAKTVFLRVLKGFTSFSVLGFRVGCKPLTDHPHQLTTALMEILRWKPLDPQTWSRKVPTWRIMGLSK